jgi:hypothetical protein
MANNLAGVDMTANIIYAFASEIKNTGHIMAAHRDIEYGCVTKHGKPR